MKSNGFRRLRLSQGRTMREVCMASDTKVSISTLSRIESNQGDPHISTIPDIARGYRITELEVLDMLGVKLEVHGADPRLRPFEGASDIELDILAGVLGALRAHGVR